MSCKTCAHLGFIGTLCGLMLMTGWLFGLKAMVGAAIGYLVALLTIPKGWKK